MSQKVFIPVTDEILYERPDLITSPLLPFQIHHPCFRWLSAEIEAVDPMTVDIDTSVELTVNATATATALQFAPMEATTDSRRKYAAQSETTADAGDNHTYQHALRRQISLPCKDAA